MDQENTLRPIYIEWHDATSMDEWQSSDEIEPVPNVIYTYGFLILESDDALVVSLNVDPKDETCSCTMIIPKSLIILRADNVIELKKHESNK